MVAARQGGSELDFADTDFAGNTNGFETKAYFGLHRLRHLAHIAADSLCFCGKLKSVGMYSCVAGMPSADGHSHA